MAQLPVNHIALPELDPPRTAALVRRNRHLVKAVAVAAVLGALIALASPGAALAVAVVVAMVAGNPFGGKGHFFSKYLLQGCVVLLGLSMDLPVILHAGARGWVFASASIAATLGLGYVLGRLLRINRKTSALISAGTAICGGSAIAAVGSVLAVTETEIAVAMGIVFILNGAALYVFPLVGHALHLTQEQFGLWAGVAIHDISSVVGAAVSYGPAALETATAVKLSRSLWIIPLVLGMGMTLGRTVHGPDQTTTAATPRRPRIQLPWFIGLFMLASLIRSLFPIVAAAGPAVTAVARGGMVAVLFMIGAGISPKAVAAVGWRAAIQAIALWLFVSVVSLIVILR